MEPVDILLVDDDPADVELTRIALRDAGAHVRLHVAGDGVEALRFLRRDGPYQAAARPALILLDLNMPKMDGRDVLKALKPDPELRSIPVLLLSTSHEERDIADAYRLHANCYVPKPYDMTGFVEVVRAIDSFWLQACRLPEA